ncbi:MAG: hypothetical protein ACRD3P_11650 [Terriglobales bacterium]
MGWGSEGDDMIGADDALVTKTETAGKIEAPGRVRKPQAELAAGRPKR